MNLGVKNDQKHKLVGHVWSKLFSCVNHAENNPDHLQLLLKKLTNIEKEIEDDKLNDDEQVVKDRHIELLVGSKEKEVEVLPPNKSSNKGSGSGKRHKTNQEIAIEENNKKQRLCRKTRIHLNTYRHKR